jgi:DNA-binding transcriptional ArsR family regulator
VQAPLRAAEIAAVEVRPADELRGPTRDAREPGAGPTQELAPLVGISEAGLSKHLRLLARVGVVESRRDGYYVVYSLAAERIAPLSDSLLRFLE